MNQKVRSLDISWETIFKIFLAIICLYLFYLIRNILLWFIFAIIISVLFEPLIDFLIRRKIPRLISVIIVYFLIFGVISLLIYLTVPIFVSEIRQFAQILPQYFEKILPPLKVLGLRAFENIEEFTELLSKTLEKMTATIFSAIAAIFGGIFATFSIFAFSLFLSLEEKPIERTLILLFPKKYEAFLLDLWSKCKIRVSGWFLSRILGCFFVGLFSYFSFLILNTKYPFSLGLLAGLLNFIPIIGPATTGILIFIIGALDNFLKAIFVLIIFALIQQIENNILLPALTKKFVGLPPVLVLLAITIGGTLWGIWGAILAIPIFGILFEFTKEFLKERKERAIIL